MEIRVRATGAREADDRDNSRPSAVACTLNSYIRLNTRAADREVKTLERVRRERVVAKNDVGETVFAKVGDDVRDGGCLVARGRVRRCRQSSMVSLPGDELTVSGAWLTTSRS